MSARATARRFAAHPRD